MANVNKVKVNNTVYDIEDTVARSSTVTMSSRADGSISLSSASAGTSVNVPSLTNFGDPGLLENDAVTEINDLKTDVDDLRSEIAQLEAIPFGVKQAMDNLFSKAAYADDDALAYYNTFHAWASSANVQSITAVYTQTGKVLDTDDLNVLRSDLVVTAYYNNSTSAVISGYSLSGDLDSAVSTITVSYEGKTDTITVNVTFPVFDYDSVRDGLLSSVEGVTRSTNDATLWTESITSLNGWYKIVGTGDANKYLYYKIGETPSTGKWKIILNARVKEITTTGVGQALGLRPQISDGSVGARFGFTSNKRVIANTSETTLTDIGSMEQGDTWHDIEAVIDASVPNQKIIIDGTTLLNIGTLGTQAHYNAIFFVGGCTVYIKTIKLYDLSA